jgi:hypothetical protein
MFPKISVVKKSIAWLNSFKLFYIILRRYKWELRIIMKVRLPQMLFNFLLLNFNIRAESKLRIERKYNDATYCPHHFSYHYCYWLSYINITTVKLHFHIIAPLVFGIHSLEEEASKAQARRNEKRRKKMMRKCKKCGSFCEERKWNLCKKWGKENKSKRKKKSEKLFELYLNIVYFNIFFSSLHLYHCSQPIYTK